MKWIPFRMKILWNETCPGFVHVQGLNLSRVWPVQGLNCPGFDLSRVCTVQGLYLSREPVKGLTYTGFFCLGCDLTRVCVSRFCTSTSCNTYSQTICTYVLHSEETCSKLKMIWVLFDFIWILYFWVLWCCWKK